MSILDPVLEVIDPVMGYFKELDLFQILAWSSIGLGLLLIILAIILW